MQIYDHYLANLAGKKPAIHANDPKPGHYRRKLADGTFVAASIWPGDEGLLCRVGSEMRSAAREWLYLAKNPIPETAAMHFYEHGCWPADMAGAPEVTDADASDPAPSPVGEPARGIGDNSQFADPFEQLVHEAQTEAEAAERWLAETKIETKDQADIAGDKLSKVRGLWSKAEKARVTEKEPHLEAGRAVDNKYRPILTMLDAIGKALNKVSTEWMEAEKERRRKEREEAERALREAHEKERQAALESGDTEPPPPEPPPLPEPEPIRIGGSNGRRVGLQTRTILKVVDLANVWKLVKSDPEVQAAIQAAATRLWKEKGRVPAGCETEEVSSART